MNGIWKKIIMDIIIICLVITLMFFVSKQNRELYHLIMCGFCGWQIGRICYNFTEWLWEKINE